MKRKNAVRFRQGLIAASAFLVPFLALLTGAADAQDSRQAVCQASWERCMASVEGKNWKPVYDRCVKARTTCLGGETYTPAYVPSSSSIPLQQSELGGDPANADPATRAALCDKGQARGENRSCTLAAERMALTDTSGKVMTCASRAVARFDPEGRVLSCGPF